MAGPEAIAVGRAVAGAAHGRSAPFLAKEKLRAKHTELAAGVRTTANYTVGQYLKDWLETLNTQAESTVTGYRIMARQLIELIGNVKLADLTVRDVQFALGKLAKRLSTRSVRLARMILIHAMRNAMVNDVVVRNLEVGTVATPSRWVRCSRAKQRYPEVRAEPGLPVRLPRS